MKLFPIMVGHRGGVDSKAIREFGDIFMAVALPWAMVEPHAAQAEKNHSQTLERLAERGGLDTIEMVAVLADRSQYLLPGMDVARANNLILNAIADFQRAREAAIPEGVTVVRMGDPVELHRTIARALGEPE